MPTAATRGTGMPDWVKPSFVIFDIWALWLGHSDAQPWASECPDVKNYKWRLNLIRHRMFYSCIHMATVGVKGLSHSEIDTCWVVSVELGHAKSWPTSIFHFLPNNAINTMLVPRWINDKIHLKFWTAFMDLNLYWIKGALALFVLVSFFWLRVLDKAEYSAFESTLNSSIVSDVHSFSSIHS